jgi:RecB family endonuclease NucS
VEIKRRKESDEVVGQIQRYMSWVDEHLAKGRRVRGIIVTSDTDKKLEYSRMGSKYQIDILPFGTSPPTDDNLKHCNNCGRPNPKSARYCQGCGKLLWM